MGSEAAARFEELVSIMARLRAPNGCPWDREQDFDSIKRYTLEETYEVLDAIDRRDWPNLAEELGDFLLQAVFHAQIASERGLFSIEDCLRSINEKLVRRHPHVFGDVVADTPEEVLKNWNEIKATEKPKAPAGTSLLDGIPQAQPALLEANDISKKAAGAGFEWEQFDDVLAKLSEEIAELQAARASGDKAAVEGEIGDVLFTVVNLARWSKVSPEFALRATNRKFRERFAYMEQRLAAHGKSLETASLAEMEHYWQEAKESGLRK